MERCPSLVDNEEEGVLVIEIYRRMHFDFLINVLSGKPIEKSLKNIGKLLEKKILTGSKQILQEFNHKIILSMIKKSID